MLVHEIRFVHETCFMVGEKRRIARCSIITNRFLFPSAAGGLGITNSRPKTLVTIIIYTKKHE